MGPEMLPEEVSAFLQSLRIGGAAVARHGDKPVRLYDFRRPDKFPKEQLRTLLNLHENFCRGVTTSLAGLLRASVPVTPVHAEQIPYGQFVRELRDPTILGIITLSPLPGNALMEISHEVAFPMIDRLLGGPGEGTVTPRALTDIETVVMRRIFHAILESMAEAWRNITDVRPNLESLETNALFIQYVPPTEVVAYLMFNVRVGKASGDIKLCYPFTMLEPVLPQLSARRWLVREARHRSDEERVKVADELAGVTLPLTAELGRARITVGELLALEVGDVIQLDTAKDAPVEVYIRGRRKFRGKPGRAGRHLAVQVTEVIREGE